MTDLTEFQRLIGKAIEEAAEDLPDSYEIRLIITNNDFQVTLARSEGMGTWTIIEEYESGGIIADIERGIAKAKELEARH